MKTSFKLLIILLLPLFCAQANAQQTAYTRDGTKVFLYDDGTWEYAHPTDNLGDIEINESGSGMSAKIIINDDLLFSIHNGMLDNFEVLRRNGVRLYDNMSGKLRKIGPYDLEYEFSTDRLKQVGPHRIEYDFSSGRIIRIGNYRIEYDFRTNKISRVGDTLFEYSFFNGKLTDIKGHTPGVRITIF